MKPGAILICSLGLAVCLIPVSQAIWKNASVPSLAAFMAVSTVFLLVLWLLRVTPAWVKVAAEAYALRLLAACDQLASANPSPIPSKLIVPK